MSQQGSKHVKLSEILVKHQPELLSEWVREQAKVKGHGGASLREGELREQCREFLASFLATIETARDHDITGPDWKGVLEPLESISKSRIAQGFSASQTASFIFSLKRPLFAALRKELGSDAAAVAESTWATTELLDNLGLHTFEVYQKTREDVISRQQEEMLELSTPVVSLWKGILALPMIGTLDSARTQLVMENLLQRIVETGSPIAIIDITGVPTVDTLTAQHLLKTVTAARLMGTECIISGIRPQIAQTIVHLGVDLGDVITKGSLADAFSIALERTGRAVVPVKAARG
jgi:rsbT co-antagonist protein RsbR